MITKSEAEWFARIEPACIAAYLAATGWEASTVPSARVWKRSVGTGPGLLQLLSIQDDIDLSHHALMLRDLAEVEERPPTSILWDLESIPAFRLRFTANPRLVVQQSSGLVVLQYILSSLYQGFRQAALQVERYQGTRASDLLNTLKVFQHDGQMVDLVVGSAHPDMAPVFFEFLALLGRPATPITTRRELEPGELHLVLEPLRQAMKSAGITELAGQYLQAGEPNLPGLGLHFRIDTAGTLLLGGDD